MKRSYSEERKIIIEEKEGDDVKNRYIKGRYLGKGGYARCYEFIHVETRKTSACKIVPRYVLDRPRVKQKLMSEIKIHSAMNHSNIVRFDHYFEDSSNVYILLELCTNQSLNELLRRRKKLTEAETQTYASQILSAMQYMHSQNVIHRDLKLGNLFLDQNLDIKIGDFGFATRIEFEGERKRTVCGTPNYIAPEIIDGESGHSYEVDIWSLGVVIFTLLTGKPPFETADIKTTYTLIRSNSYLIPESVSDTAKDLISRILVRDPSQRISIDRMRLHSFFCGVNEPTHKSSMACPVPRDTLRVVSAKISWQLPFVAAWVDYSSKYGIGYTLGDGSLGVLFNDSTKIKVSGHCFSYIKSRAETFVFDDYPPELKQKVKIIQMFKKKLDYKRKETELPGVYVKKCIRARRDLVFILSNGGAQAMLQDGSEVVLFGRESHCVSRADSEAKIQYVKDIALYRSK